jgi:hypothetical protein
MNKSVQRVASRHMEARLFGLLSTPVSNQELRRAVKRSQWAFPKGEYKVMSIMDQDRKKVIRTTTTDGFISEITGIEMDKKGNISYRVLNVSNPHGRDIEVDSLDEATDTVYRLLKDHL